MDFNSFKDTIEGAKSIVILSHVNPDGDTLGTMCAMYHLISDNFGIEADMVHTGDLPDIYRFIPGLEKSKSPGEIEKKVYDLAIAVDIAAKDRMGDGMPIFDSAKQTMNLDHHKTNNNFGDINFVRGDAACAAEVLFDIAEALNLKITETTAWDLYTAFLTDTGGFRYENTKASVLEKASRLIGYGANPNKISRHCYESKPKNFVLLHAHCMLKAKFLDDNKIAYCCVTERDMQKFHAKNDYTEGLVEELRRIGTTEVAFVLKETAENTTKASLRSKNTDVSQVAQVFGGGGHTFAAGCTIRKPLNIARDKIIEEIRKVIK